ncbi:MAG: efflux RND transporter periplasmic adaptor subunit [Myxococcales bacterium]|nr:efflux RND transporter periplasmic adaptor subunit [Myxococcales bacterium]MBK7192078.1 efflux RND transporter periplasmic adaptor subunit [Myxococcales bacterium]MBP6845639.1 efflux RND transporter periplasmic adaptor subunit [Kofleriaceae bacterium]
MPRVKRSLILGGALLALAACHGDQRAAPAAARPVIAVQTTPARAEAPVRGVAAVGAVRAQESVEIAPSVMGKITELRCVIGERVASGDVVARLSVRELSARVDQAREALANAALELDRAGKLMAQRAIPGAEYDALASRHRIATAGLAEAETMARYATVRAPIAGVVTAKRSNVGDMGLPGQPLCVIEDPSSFRFEATIPETLIRQVAIGARLDVKLDMLDAAVTAAVVEIAPTTDPASRTVLVKLELPADPTLRVGAFGRVMVPSVAVPTVTVPASAVVRNGQLASVFVVQDGKAVLRLVRTGRVITDAAGDRVEITAGVTAGDAIVVAPPAALVDGQRVTAGAAAGRPS